MSFIMAVMVVSVVTKIQRDLFPPSDAHAVIYLRIRSDVSTPRHY